MSTPTTPVQPQQAAEHEPDPIESIIHVIPFVIPLAGAVLMLLLASIAVYLA